MQLTVYFPGSDPTWQKDFSVSGLSYNLEDILHMDILQIFSGSHHFCDRCVHNSSLKKRRLFEKRRNVENAVVGGF